MNQLKWTEERTTAVALLLLNYLNWRLHQLFFILFCILWPLFLAHSFASFRIQSPFVSIKQCLCVEHSPGHCFQRLKSVENINEGKTFNDTNQITIIETRFNYFSNENSNRNQCIIEMFLNFLRNVYTICTIKSRNN